MTFRVGQKVVCVDDSPDRFGRELGVVRGEIYTIRAVLERQGWQGVLLVEVDPGSAAGWYASRFRPVVERKTDISVFHEILRTTKAPVNADARCFVGSHEEKSHG